MPTHSTQTPGLPAASLDEALARIDARTRAAHDAFERARDFAEGLDHVRGRGSRDGVAVVVNHLGVLLEVVYPTSLATTTPERLAAATTAAVRAALTDAVAQVGERARVAWGDDPLAAQVVAEATARLEAVTPVTLVVDPEALRTLATAWEDAGRTTARHATTVRGVGAGVHQFGRIHQFVTPALDWFVERAVQAVEHAGEQWERGALALRDTATDVVTTDALVAAELGEG